MKGLIYNIRGFGASGRRSQLKDYARRDRVDFLGLQETIKADFSAPELRSLEFGGQFNWNWLPANGRSGGLLLGFRDECFKVGEWRKGSFFLSVLVLHRQRNLKWWCILVYGPADHSRTAEFLGELEREVLACRFPVVVAGDFNLIRDARDKNNANLDWPRIHSFNDAIAPCPFARWRV
jgi:exonuclease III